MYQTAFPVINLEETGRNIERYRRQAQLTVRDLQTYFGFEYPQAIYKWQHGECLPTVDNLLALARLLRVSMEDLLVCEEDREAVPFYTAFRCQSVLGSELNRRFIAEDEEICYTVVTCRKHRGEEVSPCVRSFPAKSWARKPAGSWTASAA